MHSLNRIPGMMICAATVLCLAACSRQAEEASSAVEQAANSVSTEVTTEAWIDNVRVNGTTADSGQSAFAAGQPLDVTMSINGAPQGTVVTTYWYGPENRQLAYESRTVEPNQQQMTFTQENTHGWESGSYRTEVWIGDEKVEEERFDIVSG